MTAQSGFLATACLAEYKGHLQIRYPHEIGDKGLLERAYTQLFASEHPEYTEDGTKDGIIETVDHMWAGHKKGEEPVFVVIGEHLGHPTKEKIHGFGYSAYFTGSECSLQVYTPVIDNHPNRAGMLALLEDRLEMASKRLAVRLGKTLKGTFLEVDTDDADALAESKALGATAIDIPYRQPFAVDGEGVQLPFTLMTKSAVSPDTVISFIGKMYDQYETPRSNPFLRKMVSALKIAKRRFVSGSAIPDWMTTRKDERQKTDPERQRIEALFDRKDRNIPVF